MPYNKSAWQVRGAIAAALLLGIIGWVSQASAPLTKWDLIFLTLFALPWLIALFVPSTKLEFSAALVTGSSFVLTSLLILLSLLATTGDQSFVPVLLLAFTFAATNLIVLIATLRNPGKRQIDIWLVLIVGFAAGLYELALIQWIADFSKNRVVG